MADINAGNLEIVIKASVKEAIKELDKAKEKTKENTQETEKWANSFSGVKGSISNIAGSIKSLGNKLYNAMGPAMQSSMQYIENLNLLKESSHEYYDTALTFQNRLNEAFATNQSEATRYQAIFMQMGSAMGITQDKAYMLSEEMTKLTYDISSFYNISQGQAFNKLQSGLAGQARALYSLGMDITVTKLQAQADALGIEKSVSEMTQAEKVILRYITILDQSKNAQTDMARTLEQPANQLRMLQNNVIEMGRAFANVFIGTFGKILPYINAFVLVLKELFTILANLFGYDDYVSDLFGGSSSVEVDFGDDGKDLAGNMGKAEKSSKKILENLLPIDEIHNLSEPTSSGSGGGGTGGASVGGIDKKLLDAMKGYDNLMGEVKNKANDIRDKIMEWLGFTKLVDEATGKVKFKFDHITKGDVLLGIVGAVGTLALSLGKVLKILLKLGVIKMPTFKQLVNGLDKIAKVNLSNLIKLPKIFTTGTGGAITTIGLALVQAGISLASMSTQIDKLKSALNGGNLGDFFKVDSLGDFITKLEAFAGIIVTGPVPAIVMLLGKFGLLKDAFEIVKTEINNFKKAFTDFKNKIIKELKSIYDDNVKPTLEDLKEIYINDVKPIIDWIVKAWNDDIKPVIETLIGYINDLIIKSGLLKNAFSVWSTFMTGSVVTAIKTFISTGITLVKNAIEGMVDKIRAITGIVSGVVTIIKGILDGDWKKVWEGIKKTVVNAFNLIKSGIKTPINGILGLVENMVNYFVDAINVMIKALNKLKFKMPDWAGGKGWDGFNISTVSKIKIPKLATGGFVDEGQMFIARELGPELVGNIGNRTAVVNNDQIVQSVSQGVASAVASVLGTSSGENEIYGEIDGEKLIKIVVKGVNGMTTKNGKFPFKLA